MTISMEESLQSAWKRIKELEETEKRLLQKLSDASHDYVKARTILQDKLDNSLEDAWQRVAHGSVDWKPDSIYNNIMMFDYPRYSWFELQDLIKGIKR